MLYQHCRHRNWSGQVLTFLVAIGYVGSQGSLDFAPLNPDVVLYKLKQQNAHVWESLSSLPRLATSRIHLKTYYR